MRSSTELDSTARSSLLVGPSQRSATHRLARNAELLGAPEQVGHDPGDVDLAHDPVGLDSADPLAAREVGLTKPGGEVE